MVKKVPVGIGQEHKLRKRPGQVGVNDPPLKFSIRKEDRVKVIKNLGRTLLDELENLFRSYWGHRLGKLFVSDTLCVSDGLLQVLGNSVRVKTQEVHGYQLQGSEHHVWAPVY
jgi:hypothetical protein